MKRLKILRRWFGRKFGYARLVCLALLIGAAALHITDFAPVEELRVRVFDTFQRIDPRVKTARPVAIVDIDEKSLASKLGQWPWPRTRIADMVANLSGRALLTINPERDGIIRRVPMIMQAQGETMPSLSFEMLRVVTGTDTIFIKSDRAGMTSIGVKGLQVPTDRNGQLWVHFAPRDPSLYVSAIDVLEGTVPPEKIKGKLVLIGTSAVGLNDIKTTPVSRAMPGVEIHAQVLEAALTKSLLAQPPYGAALEFGAALLLGLLVLIFAPAFGPVTLVGVGALFATLLIGTSWYFFAHDRLLVDFTYPLLS